MNKPSKEDLASFFYDKYGYNHGTKTNLHYFGPTGRIFDVFVVDFYTQRDIQENNENLVWDQDTGELKERVCVSDFACNIGPYANIQEGTKLWALREEIREKVETMHEYALKNGLDEQNRRAIPLL